MPKTSGKSAHRETVERLFELMNSHRLEDLDQAYSADVVRHGPDTVGTIEGLEPLLQVARQFAGAFPDLRFEIVEVIESGNRAVVRWTAGGTHQGELPGVPPTGREVTWSGISIYRISDGRIVEEWFQEDTHGLLLQLGLGAA